MLTITLSWDWYRWLGQKTFLLNEKNENKKICTSFKDKDQHLLNFSGLDKFRKGWMKYPSFPEKFSPKWIQIIIKTTYGINLKPIHYIVPGPKKDWSIPTSAVSGGYLGWVSIKSQAQPKPKPQLDWDSIILNSEESPPPPTPPPDKYFLSSSYLCKLSCI